MILFNYSIFIYMLLIPIVSLVLLIVNVLLSTSNNYSDKGIPFECGLSSFQQTRMAFNVSFILIAILFLPFDLEISSILPYSLNLYYINSYGLIIVLLFITILTIGLIYEYNSNALIINKNNIKSIYNNYLNKNNNNSLYK